MSTSTTESGPPAETSSASPVPPARTAPAHDAARAVAPEARPARGSAWPLAMVTIAGMGLGTLVLLVLLAARVLTPHVPGASSSRIEVRPSPNVLLAVRELSRLETASFHMERIVELSDEQTHLFGLVQARDVLLLVAVGDVTAGIDLANLDRSAVQTDWERRRVRVRLPQPQVFSSALDNEHTHVYRRETDSLAARREDLESRARREAETTMRRGAIDGGILARARTGAERTLRSLLHSLGFTDVQIEWTELSEGTLPPAPPPSTSAPTLPPSGLRD